MNESWSDFINQQKIWEKNLTKKFYNAAHQIHQNYKKLNYSNEMICAHCKSTTTPLWRLWRVERDGECICNACRLIHKINDRVIIDWKNTAYQIPEIYQKLNSNERTILDWKSFIENVLSSKDGKKIRLVENFTRDLKLDKNLSFEHGTILPPIHWASKLGSIEIVKEICKLQ